MRAHKRGLGQPVCHTSTYSLHYSIDCMLCAQTSSLRQGNTSALKKGQVRVSEDKFDCLTNKFKKNVMGEQVYEQERAKDKPGF